MADRISQARLATILVLGNLAIIATRRERKGKLFEKFPIIGRVYLCIYVWKSDLKAMKEFRGLGLFILYSPLLSAPKNPSANFTLWANRG